MLTRLRVFIANLDLDALVAPVLLAIGAEQVWPGTGLLTLGAALYLPLLIETVRGKP